MSVKPLLESVLRALGTAMLLLSAAACTEMFRSDAVNSSRQANQAREQALHSMKLSSEQASPARSVSGAELVTLLAGKSHVSEYRKRIGDPKPYLTTYDYYGADGSYLGSDTHARRTVGYQDLGRWSVNGETLCIALTAPRADEKCYSIKLEANASVQYWINKPGDPTNGLLTRVVRIVRPGLQQPEYASHPSDFR